MLPQGAATPEFFAAMPVPGEYHGAASHRQVHRGGVGRMTPTTEHSRGPVPGAAPAPGTGPGAAPDTPEGWSAQRFRLFVEMMPDPAWLAGPDGAVDFCNRRWCEYTGLTLAETRTPAPASALHPDDAER